MGKKSKSGGGGGGGGNSKKKSGESKKKSSPPAPQQRSLADELGAISQYSAQNAESQANAAIRTNKAFQDQAQESTRDIAKQLDNDYTRAAQANLTGAQAGVDQVQSAQTGIGQLREQYAAQGQDPAMRRLNDMAAGQLYRPDQLRAGQVAADQVQGAQAGPVQNVESQNIRASAAERGLMNEARGGGLLGQLENQASNDLALGRSLSPEQSRDAAQSARAGMAARGLGLGNSALAAEMLNRDRFATQREAERRAFASNALNQGTGIRQTANQAYLSRQDMNTGRQLQADLANQSSGLSLGQSNAALLQQAALSNQDANLRAAQYNVGQDMAAQQANQQANQQQEQYNRAFLGQVAGMNFDQNQARTSMLSGLYGQQAGLGQTTASLQQGMAQSQVALDPYQRALGSNMPIATISPSAGLVGQAYGQTMNYGSDLFNTNTNMQASMYNSFQNNQAALRGAAMQAGATAGASQNSMMGSGMAAGGMVLGMTALAI